MIKESNIIPFEKLSDIFDNIKYEYSWVFSNGVVHNIKGHSKFRDYSFKLFLSKLFFKSTFNETAVKNTSKSRFFDDKKPIRNGFLLMRNYKF